MTTTRIHARPVGWGSWWFRLLEDDASGRDLATVKLAKAKDAGTILLGEVPFSFEPARGKTTLLRFEGVAVARARQTSGWSRRTVVEVEGGLLQPGVEIGVGRTFVLAPQGALSQSFTFGTRDAPLGRITRTGLFRRTYQLRFDASIPLGVQAFALALVVVYLRRSQRSG